LGHRETHPLKISFLVFETEKASTALWQLLLGIHDKATLMLGDSGAWGARPQPV
jgi:hypothetical protein